MVKIPFKLFLILVFCSILFQANAQSVKGIVRNEKQEPLPFVNIYFKQLQTGTTSNFEGSYFFTTNPGTYDVVFSSVGFESQTIQIIVEDGITTENVWLKTSSQELDEIIIKSKRKDPAYEIIQSAIENKKKYFASIQSFKSQVYIKATEELDMKAKRKKKAAIIEFDEGGIDEPIDPFEAERQKKLNEVANLNMVEIQMELNYQYPDKFKEIRNGYKAYGNKSGLFIPHYSETDFNFYQNLVELKGIAETPVISPLSRTAILSYKYKLEDILHENGVVVYKIKVIPRKSGNSTCSGYIYINDQLWNINRLDFKLNKGGLKLYDSFRLKQDYEKLDSNTWIPYRQEFFYESKQGKAKTFKGNTVIRHSEFQKDFQFPPKFFNNEISVTTKEAYEQDSSFWKTTRPEKLTQLQHKAVSYRDSVEKVHNSKAYLDSVQAKYNEITLGEIFLHGVGFRNMSEKRDIYVNSLIELINFEVIGGLRLGPYISYFKRYKNGKLLSLNQTLTIGLRNMDVQGNMRGWYRYDPHKLASIDFSFGRSFASINAYDAYLNQLSVSNYILHDFLHLGHRIELLNGLYMRLSGSYHSRKSLENYNTRSFLNEIIEETEPVEFDPYNALITGIRFSFTPAQRYMTEPTQKLVLGSSFPTFSLFYKKGWNGVLSSDIDFDYVEFSIKQNLILGMFGNSNYSIQTGKFVNKKDLRFMDVRRFRESDPLLYSNPLHSFQQLDTSLVAEDLFYEVHYIHHFNGALINNLPLIKKLKIRVVAGAGAIWVKNGNYRYQEAFAGLERVFKIGARRRLRLGAYGVVADSNKRQPDTSFKISFDIIDTWKKEWNY